MEFDVRGPSRKRHLILSVPRRAAPGFWALILRRLSKFFLTFANFFFSGIEKTSAVPERAGAALVYGKEMG